MENATMYGTAGLTLSILLVATMCGDLAVDAASGAPQRAATTPSTEPADQATLNNAKFACPMETHPRESDPARQGAYFSIEPGDCPWCGMQLKPVDELAWVRARQAAQGGEVAYTCPDHQHVFARTSDKCPRCGRTLEPFKVMYTCPDPQHAGLVRAEPGECPHDARTLVPFRGVWLSPEMADRNVPARPELAEGAQYRCSLHPLVHSDGPGDCTICARALAPRGDVQAARTEGKPLLSVPADARYVCPMEQCGYFAAEPGRCPECGMQIKPIGDVRWAASLRDRQQTAARLQYVCPMHVERVRTMESGTCPICGMQLVDADTVARPTAAPAAIATQMNYLMEHYLALQKRFSSDRAEDAALHALGLVGAADEILKRVGEAGVDLPAEFGEGVRRLRAAALKLTGKDLDADRVTFVGLSGAMRTLVEYVRPDRKQYPKIYIFHCPMTKGDWLQTSDDLANPFYGFKMLKCGELQSTK